MIVGIAGRAGAGKSYLADQLIQADERFVHLSFGATLREEIAEVMGGECPNLWVKPTSPEVRWILQQYGTNFRRDQDPDYWVKKSSEKALSLQERGKIPVYADVRFPNEAHMIQSSGGVLVRVVAPTSLRQSRLGELPPEHASETALDSYEIDWEIPSILDDDLYQMDVERLLAATVGEA